MKRLLSFLERLQGEPEPGGRPRIAPRLPAAARRRRRFARGVYRLVQGLIVHDAFQAAPAMAFHFFLSLMPLLAFVGYVVARVAKHTGIERILSPVLDGLPGTTEDILKAEIFELAGATTLGPVAAVGFLWIASGGTHGLMDALETVVGAPRRPWWKQRALSVAWVVASVLVIAAGSWAIVQGGDLAGMPVERAPSAVASESSSAALRSELPAPRSEGSAVRPLPSAVHGDAAPPPPPRRHRYRGRRITRLLGGSVGQAMALLGLLGIATAALASFYYVAVSHPPGLRRRVVPGALLAVASWVMVSWMFGLYVRSLAGYALFYGSLTAVAVFLLWLWLTSLAILVGAELNAQLEGLRDEGRKAT